jgi:glycosyltransferase involved in cell wall biosynthesis
MITMFKNEAHSIGRMLESVAPYIDYWVIQDNGSTDGTPEVVKEWAMKYRIDGHLYKVEEGWVGFGWNRDHLLQRAKSLNHGCNWIMKMDCDEVLEVDPSFDWSIFDDTNITAFSVAALGPGIIYQRTWIWNAKLNWKFHHDPAHETIYLDDGVTNENFSMHSLPKEFRMKADDSVRGESYVLPTKYVSDALALEEKLIREQSLFKDWYHFWYIGKSYEDAFKCQSFPLGEKQQRHYAERSIFYYKEWVNFQHDYDRTNQPNRLCEMGYYAMNSIGNSYRFLGQTEKAIEYFKRAEPFCSRRNDHLIWLAETYMHLGDFDEMLKYTTEIMKPERTMPFPDFVFIISTDMYHDTSEYPKNLHNVALQNATKKEESMNYCELKNQLTVNPNRKKRIFVVDDFYADPIAVRNFALGSAFEANNNWYKGSRSIEKYRPTEIKEAFENIMGIKIREWESHGMNGSFQYCTPEDLLVYHYDSQTWAGMIYLTPNAPYDCGTSLWASRITNARHVDQDPEDRSFAGGFYDQTKFELVDTIGNVFNRLVLFDARCFHSASKYFGKTIDDSRLFHLFFFD